MKTLVGYIIDRGGRISGHYNGKPFSVERDNPEYSNILTALDTEDYGDFDALLNAATKVVKYTEGNIRVDGNTVLYKGEEVHNSLSERILEFAHKKYPYKSLLLFLDNLMLNPSMRARNELYKFLEYHGIPISEDGCFLAYKGLRSDYYDIHSGKFLNKPGSRHKMERMKVDDDASKGCSYGFHVGTHAYAQDFSQGQLVLCKVNPKDVVSVPTDCNCQKVRTCEYLVLQDCKGLLDRAYYNNVDDVYVDEVNQYDYEESDDEDF